MITLFRQNKTSLSFKHKTRHLHAVYCNELRMNLNLLQNFRCQGYHHFRYCPSYSPLDIGKLCTSGSVVCFARFSFYSMKTGFVVFLHASGADTVAASYRRTKPPSNHCSVALAHRCTALFSHKFSVISSTHLFTFPLFCHSSHNFSISA